MSFTASFYQSASLAGVQMLPLARGLLTVALVAGFLVFFRPLLTGLFRALLLTFKPRMSKEQRAARRHMRDAQLFKRMINSSQEPSQAAELRAIATRT